MPLRDQKRGILQETSSEEIVMGTPWKKLHLQNPDLPNLHQVRDVSPSRSEREDADAAPGLVLTRPLETWTHVAHTEHVCGHTQEKIWVPLP